MAYTMINDTMHDMHQHVKSFAIERESSIEEDSIEILPQLVKILVYSLFERSLNVHYDHLFLRRINQLDLKSIEHYHMLESKHPIDDFIQIQTKCLVYRKD